MLEKKPQWILVEFHEEIFEKKSYFLRKKTEGAIGGISDWHDGKTSREILRRFS